MVRVVKKSIKRIVWLPFLLLSVLILGTVSSSVVKASQTPRASLDSLQSAIDAVLADQRLAGAQADVDVRSAKDGSVLYAQNENNRLIPASNAKLYSSTAALKALGGDYTFKTIVSADGQQYGPVLNGNVYLKGTGDPTITPADYDALAARIADSGIRVITGKLVADDTFFDSRQLGNNWAWDNGPFSYQPEISALTVAADANFDIGSLTIETTPAAPGKPPLVRAVPDTSFVTIQNNATTGAEGSANTISIDRQQGVNKIIVSGSIPAGSAAESDLVTVTDTTGYVQSLFRDDLQRHGVIVVNTDRGSTPATARTIASRSSIPLSQLYTPFLKLSNNGIAEILVKTMGAVTQKQGTWDAGLNTELSTLGDLGVDTNKIQIVDGSGLSNLDFVSPAQTTNLLLAAHSQPWFSTWYNALPIAGQSDPLIGGTLRSRMIGTKAAGNVHAKTGSLVGVSALSGYVTDADGDPLVFSIMENNYIAGSPKPLEDAIAVDLANFSQQNGVQTRARSAPLQTLKTAVPSKQDGLECSWTKPGC